MNLKDLEGTFLHLFEVPNRQYYLGTKEIREKPTRDARNRVENS